LALALAVPALVAPTAISAAIREESRLHAFYLGNAAERDALERARRWLGLAASPDAEIAQAATAQSDPLSERLANVGARILETAYFERARALVRLAAHRAAALVEWLLLGLPILIAAIADGAVMRTVKTRSFVHLSPVLFGLGLHGALAVLGGALVLLLVPHTIHPLAWAGLLASLAVAARSTVANFHRLR
jgi:hypothetical protein